MTLSLSLSLSLSLIAPVIVTAALASSLACSLQFPRPLHCLLCSALLRSALLCSALPCSALASCLHVPLASSQPPASASRTTTLLSRRGPTDRQTNVRPPARRTLCSLHCAALRCYPPTDPSTYMRAIHSLRLKEWLGRAHVGGNVRAPVFATDARSKSVGSHFAP
ncbi:hypothetical protein IWX90DRAFT_258090 [Phyllosticta citrichinensis]|uniref:Secreted protein n=1 Tax=Phyllosticta citrichinensis TaxID=1130410 RepID=A0ABR1XRU4_9PEZI